MSSVPERSKRIEKWPWGLTGRSLLTFQRAAGTGWQGWTWKPVGGGTEGEEVGTAHLDNGFEMFVKRAEQ